MAASRADHAELGRDPVLKGMPRKAVRSWGVRGMMEMAKTCSGLDWSVCGHHGQAAPRSPRPSPWLPLTGPPP